METSLREIVKGNNEYFVFSGPFEEDQILCVLIHLYVEDGPVLLVYASVPTPQRLTHWPPIL